MAEAGEQSEDGGGGVEVESGREGNGGKQREEFGKRQLEKVEHVVQEEEFYSLYNSGVPWLATSQPRP
jgi:hypothetical protein